MQNKKAFGYATTWNVLYEGLREIIDSELYTEYSELNDKNLSSPTKFIAEGLGISLIIGLASVCEGLVRTFLRSYVVEAFNSHEEYKVKVNHLNKGEKIIHNGETFTLEKLQKINYETVKRINSSFPKKKTWLKSFKKENHLTKDENVAKINNESWINLSGLFKKIYGKKLKCSLEEDNKGLFSNIEFLFKLRNFLIHSNFIEVDFNKKEIYSGKFNEIKKYLEKNDLFVEKQNSYFIQLLINEEIISHLKSAVDNFLKSSFLKESEELKNQINILNW